MANFFVNWRILLAKMRDFAEPRDTLWFCTRQPGQKIHAEPGDFKTGLTLDSVLAQNNITNSRKWQAIDVKMVFHPRFDFSTLMQQKLKSFTQKTDKQH
jgi:hypothetical protein